MSSVSCSVALAFNSQQSVFAAGESGPVWRVVQGIVCLDRHCGPVRQPVQLALPGDLIGVESVCGQTYQLSAVAFLRCHLEEVKPAVHVSPQTLLQQVLLQHMRRSQDMAQLRTGSVVQRLGHLLQLMNLGLPASERTEPRDAKAIRQALPALREVALLVDAQTETVCRALGQLLPARRRKERLSSAVTHVRRIQNGLPQGVWSLSSKTQLQAAA